MRGWGDAGAAPSRRTLWRRARIRRWAAAALVALAAWAVLSAVLPEEPPAGVPVLIATRNLPAGHRLEASDLRVGRWPVDLRPSRGYARAEPALGAALAGPLAAGDAVTRDRLQGSALLADLPSNRVIAHIRPGDPGLLDVLRPGDRVDALSTVDGTVVAGNLLVLAVSPGPPSNGGFDPLTSDDAPHGTGVLVATTPATASRLAGSQGDSNPDAGVMLTLRHRSG